MASAASIKSNLATDVLKLCRGEPGWLTPDQLIAILQGQKGEGLREVVLQVLREGVEWNRWDVRSPVADICVKHGNVRLLERICLELDDGKDAAWWLDQLCSYSYYHPGDILSSKQHKGSAYVLAKNRMRFPGSFELLQLAYRVNPAHESLFSHPGNQGLDDTCPEGTVHYGMLQGLLFGWERKSSVIAHAQRVGASLADQIADQYVDFEPDMRLLRYMREIKAPCEWAPGLALDAAPFALSPAPVKLVKPLLKAYMDAGLVDIDAPVHKDHDGVGTCRPLDIAIWAGASGAAAALIELGCRLDVVALCYGGDPIRSATEQGRMSTATSITEALMRRQLAGGDAHAVAGRPTARTARRGI